MQNIKIVSDINKFQIGNNNYSPVQGQFVNPGVNWFYLLDYDNEKIRCFTEDEATQVTSFLVGVKHHQFGNKTSCFINFRSLLCHNEECEDEVANGMGGNNPLLRNKILPSDFGVNFISKYNLNYNIIGYLY